MSRALLLLIAAGVLSGCHVSAGNSDGNVSVSTDNSSKLSFNLPFAKGEINLPKDAVSHSQFDIDGVKMIPGGTIRGFTVDAGESGALVHLAFAAPQAPDQVRSYFLDQFRKEGDEASQSADAITGKSKDGGSFVIDVKAGPKGSEGTIAIQAKD